MAHEAMRARGWTPAVWRTLDRRDQVDVLAFDLWRLRRRVERAHELLGICRAREIPVDPFLVQLWLTS